MDGTWYVAFPAVTLALLVLALCILSRITDVVVGVGVGVGVGVTIGVGFSLSGVGEALRSQHISAIQNASVQRTHAILADLHAERDSIRVELASSKQLCEAIQGVLGKGTHRSSLMLTCPARCCTRC